MMDLEVRPHGVIYNKRMLIRLKDKSEVKACHGYVKVEEGLYVVGDEIAMNDVGGVSIVRGRKDIPIQNILKIRRSR